MPRYPWILVAVLAALATSSTSSANEKNDLFEYVAGVGYYHVVTALHNWTDAYANCQSLGSRLAVANSDVEASVLTRLAQNYSSSRGYAFVGVSDLNLKREFITVDGDLIARAGYNKWTDKEASILLRCVGISQSGEGLTYENCSEKSESICEIPIWKRDYTRVRDIGYYKAYKRSWSWPQAMLSCQSHGGHLAIINSMEEYEAIQEIYNQQLTGVYDDFVWIGGHSQFNYFNYVTVLGVPINETGFNIWAPGHPSTSPGYLGLERNGYLSTRYAYTGYPEPNSAICEHAID